LLLPVVSTAYWPSSDSIVPTVPPLVSLTVAPTVTVPEAGAVDAEAFTAGAGAALLDVAGALAAGELSVGVVDCFGAVAASVGTAVSTAAPVMRNFDIRIPISFSGVLHQVMRGAVDRTEAKRRMVPQRR
jgi:hypothetical protein